MSEEGVAQAAPEPEPAEAEQQPPAEPAANSGVGEPGAAGDGQGPAGGAYVPPRGSGTTPAAPAPEPPPEDDASARERSYERVTGKRSGRSGVDGDDRSTLDYGSDAAYSDLAASQRMARESTTIFKQGLRAEQSSVSFGDYSPAMTQTVIVHTEARKIRLEKGTFGPKQLRRITHPHVEVLGFAQMREELRLQKVIVLQGEEGSGRRATAVNLLASLDIEHIGIVDVEPDVSLRDISEGEWFEARHGHALEITGAVPRATVTTLSAKAARVGAHLVILTGPARGNDDILDRQGFAHQAAAAEEVLLQHLTHFLEDHTCQLGCTEETKADYARRVTEDIATATAYTLPWQPWELVKIARRIADNIHAEVPTETLVRRDPAALRRLAVDALTVDDDDGKVEASRRQGFRIAYAVFHECHLADVIRVGELFGEILPLFEKRVIPPDHVVFDGMIETLLDAKMWINKAHGSVTASSAADVPRRARLTDQALAGIFLDVVWNDFDALRGPVMVWLDLLAGSTRTTVQVRAATAAGFLATFDFDEIYRVLIRDWSLGSLVYRQSAAYALQMAATDARLTARIRRQVRDWAESSKLAQQDTAARAYGRLIGVTNAEEAVAALRPMAGKSSLAASPAIAIGMANLFPHQPQAVLQELARWNGADDANRRRHADRALLLLTKFAGPNATEGWPAMFKLAADDQTLRKSFAKMWADALISSDTARGAWDPLRKWILAADADPDLAEVVLGMAPDIFDTRDPRTVFHLVHWCHRHPESLVLKSIYDKVVPGEYRRPRPESRS